jgi:hypothetical protein
VAQPRLQSAGLHQGPAEGEEPADTMTHNCNIHTHRYGHDLKPKSAENGNVHNEDEVSRFSTALLTYIPDYNTVAHSEHHSRNTQHS